VAWSVPRTWTDGETITTVLMNQYVRDELLALLTVPCAKMQLPAAGVSIPNTGVDTLVTITLNIIDTDTMVDAANNRLVVKTAGKFNIGAFAAWPGDATGTRIHKIKQTRGGTTTTVAEARGPASPAGNQTARVCGSFVDCQVNDYFQLFGNQTGAAAQTLIGAASGSMGANLWAYRTGT
jgi:hypothetical protein